MNKEAKLSEVYFFQLERTVRRFRKFSQREFAKRGYDITGEQWVVLKRVYESPGISQSEISETTYKDPASLTRMIDLLELRGLLKRQAMEGDRRSTSVLITKKGTDLVEEVLPLAVEMRVFGMRGVSESDKKIFMAVLDKIYENLE